MTGEFSPSVSWLVDFQPLFGSKIDLVLEPRPEDPAAPKFDYGNHLPKPRTIVLQEQGDFDGEWLRPLTAELQSIDWEVSLTNLVAIPPRTLRSNIEGRQVLDGAAFLAEVLRNTPHGKLIIALSAAVMLLSEQGTPLRAWLAKAHRVEGIIYLGAPATQLLGAPPQLSLVLMMIRSGPEDTGATQIVRMVNLRESPRADWSRIVTATAKRGGGEVGPSIVLRSPDLDGRPWTYERFSKRYKATREDAKQLGTLCPLGDFVADLRMGLHRTLEAQRIVDVDDAGGVPDGAIACFGGRSIGRDARLLSPVCAVMAQGLSDELLLRPGDVLVRSIVRLHPDHPWVFAATVTKEILPATFDRTCIRIRWGSDVRPDVAELHTGYLNSTHTRDWLIANGVQISLNVNTLRCLEVPDPSKELLGALETLADAEQQYRTWANEAADTRRGLFVTTSFAEQLPLLLGRQRTEIERLRAARDAEGLDYQIRNYYPHPIALRWEFIRQAESGKLRIDAVLDCAEHLLTLLAIVAILQESSTKIASGPVRATLLSFSRAGSLHLDWGKCVGLLHEGVKFTVGHSNPLALCFPELASLSAPMSDESSDWFQGERYLREWRNKQAHLQRLPDSELNTLSDEFVKKLHWLLEAASFISTLPLVHVEDYTLSPVSLERNATFRMLQGTSPVFPRTQRKVQAELPRGAVGFLNQGGEFVSALPWLTMNPCPVCKRLEIFVFNRYERNEATYIAMETGHPNDNKLLVQSIAAVIAAEVRA